MKENNAWIVVTVERGYPASVALYKQKRAATVAERRFRKAMNADYDEVGSFVIDLDEFDRMGTVRDEI